MVNHRISFIHNDTEYSFIKPMNERLSGCSLAIACREEVRIYMAIHGMRGIYILTGMAEL